MDNVIPAQIAYAISYVKLSIYIHTFIEKTFMYSQSSSHTPDLNAQWGILEPNLYSKL